MRFQHLENACTLFSFNGKTFHATPRDKKVVRHCKKTANQSAKDLALVAKGIYCHEQWLRWKKSKEVMPFEKTKLYKLLDESALEALPAWRAEQEEKAKGTKRAKRAQHE